MNAKFNLETPGGSRLDTVTRFSGWYIPDHDRRPQLYVACNGKREALLEWGSIRPDVSSAFPSQSQSMISGFQGDVLMGESAQAPELDVVVCDAAAQGRELFRRRYAVGPYHPPALRERSFALFELLVCPECRSPLAKHETDWGCPRCGMSIAVRGGVPHFLHAEGTPCLHLSEQTNTHIPQMCSTFLGAIERASCSISGLATLPRICCGLTWSILMPFSISGPIWSVRVAACPSGIRRLMLW